MSQKDDWFPGYVDPALRILRDIERIKAAANANPELDVKPQLDGLSLQMYRLTGAGGR